MRVSVMTYNLGNGLADAGRLVGMLRDVGADLVGLQEVALEHAQAIRRDLADMYPHQVVVPSGFAGKGLLSRYPVAQSQELSLYPGRSDLQVSVRIDGLALHVLVAHPPPRLRAFRFGFETQALAQIEAVGALALRHAPAVVLGDFNMTPRHPAYARLIAAGLVDAFAAVGSGRGWTLPMRVGHSARFDHRLQGLRLRPVARVDYIWLTPLLTAEAAWLGPDAGSDHLPVLARLGL